MGATPRKSAAKLSAAFEPSKSRVARITTRTRTCWMPSVQRQAPSPPAPLPQGARGEEHADRSLSRTNLSPSALLPSPLAGEGSGGEGAYENTLPHRTRVFEGSHRVGKRDSRQDCRPRAARRVFPEPPGARGDPHLNPRRDFRPRPPSSRAARRGRHSQAGDRWRRLVDRARAARTRGKAVRPPAAAASCRAHGRRRTPPEKPAAAPWARSPRSPLQKPPLRPARESTRRPRSPTSRRPESRHSRLRDEPETTPKSKPRPPENRGRP